MNITAEKQHISREFGYSYQRISQSYLALEKTLGTQNDIVFNVLENAGSPSVTERRLALSDEFIITHAAVLVSKIGSATPTDAQRAIAKMYSWVNPSVFDGTNDANIQALFNGEFSLTVSDFNFLPAMSMRDFLRVPETQAGTFTGVEADGTTDTSQAGDSRTNGLFGYYPTDLIKITGQDKIVPKITLPASVNMAEDSETNTVHLLFKGYLITG
jgi:hypothetical protein